MSRHKWNGNLKGESSGFKGGLTVGCLKCDCVKEIIGGRVTYFLNDTVTEKAPECDGNNLKVSSQKMPIQTNL